MTGEKMSSKMATITCKDRNGLHEAFDVYDMPDTRLGRSVLRYDVVPEGVIRQQAEAAFELVLGLDETDSAKVISANHFFHPTLQAKGIPDALLPFLQSTLQIKLYSSSNLCGSKEYRNDAATKYWKRLEKSGIARYDASRDVYELG